MSLEKNIESIAKSLVSIAESLKQNQSLQGKVVTAEADSSPAQSGKKESSPGPKADSSPAPAEAKETKKVPVSDKDLTPDTNVSVKEVNRVLVAVYNRLKDRAPITELMASEPYCVHSVNDLKREHYEQLIKDAEALEN